LSGQRSATPSPKLEHAVAEAVAKAADHPGALLSVLEECQRADQHHYLSKDALGAIAAAMGLPLSRVYSVATFYSYFNLTPQGDHVVVVCRGTACHTRGSLGLLRELLAELGGKDFKEDEESSFTTDDMHFTVRTVACFGQCALAPVVAIDGRIYSRVTPAALKAAVSACKAGGKS
jgi:NADH-quinone oxidoreductase subunit E